MYKCKYFGIKELVSPLVYKQFGDFAWSFFDENFLKDLDLIREKWGSPIIINDWAWGGQYKESGLRCNMDSLVKGKSRPYLSGHVLGKGADPKPRNKKVIELHDFIIKISKEFKSIRRIEAFIKTPTWVHVDGLNTDSSEIVIF